uniref:Uncharacterized protein n=1 Tax=Arundo donax TaxID=35708 RepID=A0A0A9DC58_ARUDO
MQILTTNSFNQVKMKWVNHKVAAIICRGTTRHSHQLPTHQLNYQGMTVLFSPIYLTETAKRWVQIEPGIIVFLPNCENHMHLGGRIELNVICASSTVKQDF